MGRAWDGGGGPRRGVEARAPVGAAPLGRLLDRRAAGLGVDRLLRLEAEDDHGDLKAEGDEREDDRRHAEREREDEVGDALGNTDLDYQQMDYKICGELDERNKALEEVAMTSDGEQLIQIRIQQLALNKLLVNVHKKDLFLLVTAYTRLG